MHWSDEEGARRARELFSRYFGDESTEVFAAPGRVNLIGEHTDYNDGLCMPMALPHATFVAFHQREDDAVRLISDAGELWEGRVGDIRPGMERSWVNYAGGPTYTLGVTRGFDAAVVSCVPLGAGLSSSAAIECAMAFALRTPTTEHDREAIVEACIRAENEIAGAPTGGMDQTVSVFGRDAHAVFIDFAAETRELVEADFAADDLAILVMDTRAKHSLSDGQYGNRRAECDQARDMLGYDSLREATDADLEKLPQLLARRVRHVISENARVVAGACALQARDWQALGREFAASHASLRDDFEVSCEELDCVVESAMAAGAFGARMTGGGFGGSAIALVKLNDIEKITEEVRRVSCERGFAEPAFLVAQASSGARLAV
ncbi:galactokinase [Arcanobacterium canis]|uniref:Galactokinase n=1 Tax=Arcanobacterium canis TaxID=999183 RepID=A0ABY8G0P6_9ACTO|nr:galactokinase [Arcanobacterium canis]WFM83370.1 galactokinase [Arcanobacterium canis]